VTEEELAAVAALWKRSGRTLTTRFTGTSMRPAIDDGAEVTLLCVDDVGVGDVVAYAYGDRVIVHRIVSIWDGRFVTRGDANLLPDPLLLERGDIIGKIASESAAPQSFLGSMTLAWLNFIARFFGTRTALRVIGVFRAAHRRRRHTIH